MKAKQTTLYTLTFILALFVGVLTSCSNDDSCIQKNPNNIKTRAYSSQIEEAKALALPINEVNSIPKEIKDKRAAAVILSNYISIKDSLYSLDISEKDAQTIGVDADLYNSVLQDLKNTNKAITEARLHGEKVSLPNVKEESKKYRMSKEKFHKH